MKKESFDEKVGWGRMLLVGFQHVLTMCPGTIAVPLILAGALGLDEKETAFLVSANFFTSGIAILINYLTGCPIGLFVFVFNILIVGLATADNDRVEIFTGVVFINRSKGIRFLFYDRQVREDILVFLAHVFHSCIQLHIIDRP